MSVMLANKCGDCKFAFSASIPSGPQTQRWPLRVVDPYDDVSQLLRTYVLRVGGKRRQRPPLVRWCAPQQGCGPHAQVDCQVRRQLPAEEEPAVQEEDCAIRR